MGGKKVGGSYPEALLRFWPIRDELMIYFLSFPYFHVKIYIKPVLLTIKSVIQVITVRINHIPLSHS